MGSDERGEPGDAGDGREKSAAARIEALLEKLAAIENLASTLGGTSEAEVRADLREAARIIRESEQANLKKRWPMHATLLDWRDMTVAEALEILADHAQGQADKSGDERKE